MAAKYRRISRFHGKITLKKVKAKKGQSDVFFEIWNERPHICAECGRPLSQALPSVFSHYLPKGKYPNLKLCKQNIDLLCYEHHYQWDFGDRKSMKIYDENRIQLLKQLDNDMGKSGLSLHTQ